jgi:hypothetical protein
MDRERADGIIERGRDAPRALRLPEGRTVLAAACLVLLVAASILGAVRRPGARALGVRAAAVPTLAALSGRGPFVLYAVQLESEKTDVYAVDLGALPADGRPPAIRIGRFAGRVNDAAGSQGLARGKVVPMLVVESAVDQNAVTRLWMLHRAAPPEVVLSTTDLVPGYALDATGTRIAVARRNARSATPGTMLWIHRAGVPPRFFGAFHRPGGIGVRDAMKPVSWTKDGRGIVAEPFCDGCETLAGGLYLYDTEQRTARAYPDLATDETFEPAWTADGSSFAVARLRRSEACGSPQGNTCAGGEQLLMVDTATRRGRVIAETHELRFDSPRPSPLGRVVAYASGRDHQIEWRDTWNGLIAGIVDVPSADVSPVGWLGETQLLAVATSESLAPGGPSQAALIVVTRTPVGDTGREGAHMDVVALAPNITYLGWLS